MEPKFPRFSKVPWDVMTDDQLTATDIRVYCILGAYGWKTGVATIGLRWIAECAKVSYNGVRASIDRLVKHGHIAKKTAEHRADRSQYRLTATLFADPKYAPCLKCSKPTAKLNRAGWCKRCTASVELRFARSA